jgi:UDP-2,3-diacylglucosamine pyrophosphatase LpxH
MLCIVSDLHLTDEALPGSATDEDLATFVRELGTVAERDGEPVTLVFLGDILELLRSRRWSALWARHGAAPWIGSAPGFVNFVGGHSETCAVEVATEIRRRYGSFEAEVRRLVDAGHLITRYVPGNHDFMVQLSRDLRAILVDFLGLRHDPANEFETCFLDASSSVLATHGHAHDPVNWHRREDGYWAMGDAVVLRVVNRFAEDACAALGQAPQTRLAKLIQDVENVEPLPALPIYIRWLSETQLSVRSERETLLRVWKSTVDDFLALPHFLDPKGFGGSPYQDLRTALRLSTMFGLAELITKLSGVVGLRGPDYRGVARELGASRNFRYVVFGHTHEPALIPVAERGGQPAFYVNTGCWRRVITGTEREAGGVFLPRRVSAHFVVDTARNGERYGLHQVCRAT